MAEGSTAYRLAESTAVAWEEMGQAKHSEEVNKARPLGDAE